MSSGDTVVKGLDKLTSTRKVKQISAATTDQRVLLYALCWDGSMWVRELTLGTKVQPDWVRIKDIPS